jgi:hypothetical protein
MRYVKYIRDKLKLNNAKIIAKKNEYELRFV